MRIFIVFLIATVSACSVGATTAIESSRPAPAPSFLRGQLQNDRGFQLEGLSVLAVSQEQGGSRTGLTDSNGMFVINDLTPGRYRLVILRGSKEVWQQPFVYRSAVRNVHLVLPTLLSDSPLERPIVDRAQVRFTPR